MSLWSYQVVVILLALQVSPLLSQDDLCYLTNGGASETFPVNERIPIGSLVGTLPIQGDPSQKGNIDLRLQPPDRHVAFLPHSKSLVLTAPLDKEGVEGPSSVLVHVQCTPRHTDDLSIDIPVRLVVMDANDNPPEFVGGPFEANVSEVAMVGAVVIQNFRAVDKDQQGPYSTVEYSIDPGPYSQLLAINNPLDGTVTLAAPLDYETLPEFVVVLRAQDQGEPPLATTANLTIHVLDADDQNPRFTFDHYEAILPDPPNPGSVLEISPGPLFALDPDEGIQSSIEYTFNSDGPEYTPFHLDPQSGTVTLAGLPEGSGPVTLVVRAGQTDSPDRYALTTLTVAGPGPTLRCPPRGFTATVAETAPVGQTVLSVHLAPSKDLRFKILDLPSQTFQIQETGEVVVARQLDYEIRQMYTFRVLATDGHKSAACRVNVTVLDVNDHDPEFSETQYNFLVSDPNVREGLLVGRVAVNDRDLHDTVDLKLKGPLSKAFSVSSEGELRLRSPRLLNGSAASHLVLVAVDSGVPPRRTSVPLTVTLARHAAASPGPPRSDGLMLAGFGVALGSLLLVVATLAVYIAKSKRYGDRLPTLMRSTTTHSSAKMAVAGFLSNGNGQPQTNGRPPGVDNPIFAAPEYAVVRKKAETPVENGSIPRRVKKLSWDDDTSRRTELDPDVSVAPLTAEDSTLTESQQPNRNELTVYF